VSEIAELYGLDAARSLQVDEHASCQDAGQLYGGAYCLATRKAGVCAGVKRGGAQQQQVQPYQRPHVAVPVAPGAKTRQQSDMEQAAQGGYAAAYQHAQQLAQQLGANPGHATVQAAAGDYAHALHQHGRAVARADQLHARLQQRHDSAEARNKTIDQANAARQSAAVTRANAQAKRQALHRAAARHPRPRSHHSTWIDEVGLYALGQPVQFTLYGLVAAAHWGCEVGEFCRNPLHPGPCKGWKHMLHSVAPGAYHAYEKQRVAKLNEKRKAKIAELKAAGKPIPKYLLKEVTYAPVPAKPSESQFVPPTPKEAVAKLPATAKEIGAKIALKHEAIAKEKADKQAAAITSAMAAVFPVTTVGSQKVKDKAAEIVASLKPGEKLSEHPVVENTIKEIVQKADTLAGGDLTPNQKTLLHQDIAAHIDQGIPEPPLTLQSIANGAKQKQAEAEKAAAKAKAVTQAHGTGRAAGGLTPTGKVLGTHGASVQKDETGKEFLVKQADFTGQAEVGASKLAAAVGLATPQVHNNGSNVVQEIVPGAKDAFPGKHFDPNQLSDKDILDLQKHHVLDWLIGNHDAHPGNFLRDKDGNLVEIDKGQAFKHYAHDELSSGFHPNAAYGEMEPVYNTLLKAAKAGKVDLYDPKQGELGDFIKKVQGLPDSKIKAMFRPYAEAAAKEGKLPGAPGGGKIGQAGANPAAVEGFLDKIIDRRNKLQTAFTAVHAKHQPAGVNAPKTPGALAVEAQKILNTQGLSVTTKADELTKEHFDALPTASQQKLVNSLKDVEADAGHDMSVKATKLIEKFTGTAKPPVSKPVSPAAPLATNAPPHVKHAQSLATGATYGTAKAKLDTYGKLTKDEFQSLPLDVQESIHKDLNSAHAKFLDPKKKAQVQGVLNKIGSPTASPAGAGAPHEKPVVKPKYEQMAEAHKAVAKLAGSSASSPHFDEALKHSYKTQHSAGDIDYAANALANQWSDKHLLGLGLKPSEQFAIKTKAVAEIKKMISDGEPVPPSGGVLFVTAHLPEGASSVSKAELLKYAAELPKEPKIGAGAGGSAVVGAPPLAGTPAQVAKQHHDAYKIAAVLAGGTGTSSQSTPEKFEQAKNAGTLTKQIEGSANAVASSFLANKAPADLSDADGKKLKAKVAEEAHQMIVTGALKPPIGGVLEAAKQGKTQTEILKAAGITPPKPGSAKAGSDVLGVVHEKAAKIAPHPDQPNLKQVVATGQTAKVNAFNKKAAEAVHGESGLDLAPLSVGKLANMYDGYDKTGSKKYKKLSGKSAWSIKNAFHAYSGSQHHDINGLLRREAKGEVVGESYKKANQQFIDAMDAGFSHSKLPQSVVVHRGLPGPDAFGEGWRKDKSMVGVEVTDHGYASTSVNYHTAAGFAGGQAVVMRIVLPKGQPAVSLVGGQHSGEAELLLPRGTKFRVVADNGWQNGYRHLDVEIIK
jgi:hypothetical protein